MCNVLIHIGAMHVMIDRFVSSLDEVIGDDKFIVKNCLGLDSWL